MVEQTSTALAGASAVPEAAARSGGTAWTRYTGIALLGSLAVAVAAHVAVPLPWTPVPLTLQPMAVLLVGLLAGPTLGFATMLLYLAEGAMGLPVFQPHGPGGLLQLAGPTGGFLWSYPLVAMIAGALFRRLRLPSRFASAMTASSLATFVLFAAGAAQLAVLTHAGVRTILAAAVLPFLPGELVKILAASGIAAAWQARAAGR
jgi:biotin transport system substrate-specific component